MKVMIPDEPYSAGKATKGETGDHVSVDHIVVFAAGSGFALLFQHAKAVSSIWLMRVPGSLLVAFGCSSASRGPKGLCS